MPQYKLNYFNARGYGEAARLIFHYAGQEFEDSRWTNEQWLEIKPTSETGKAPWLEVDGVRIYGSVPLTRYLGTIFGLIGKDAMENAQIDSIIDTYKDCIEDIWPYALIKSGRKEGDIEEVKPAFEEARKRFLTYLTKILENSGSGFLGSKFTWADAFLAEGITTMLLFDDHLKADYPKIVQYKERVHSLPKIKEYVEKRPNNGF
uniref:glutathione transferase n=1 Tax=Panagrolaimus davidi TaxID=227884 RepID=A0A914QK43_9BILA